jgi:hypothetical protein
MDVFVPGINTGTVIIFNLKEINTRFYQVTGAGKVSGLEHHLHG